MIASTRKETIVINLKLGRVAMKKMAVLLTALSLTFASVGNAQTYGRGANQGAQTASSNGFAWAIGFVGVAVLATMAGLVAASAASNPTTFSHN